MFVDGHCGADQRTGKGHVMIIRSILAITVTGAIAFLLAGMFLYPSDEVSTPDRTATNISADQEVFVTQQDSAPLLQYDFPEYGFNIMAPEDWRIMSNQELKRIIEEGGEEFIADEMIVGLTPAQPEGVENAVIQIMTLKEPMDDMALSALNTMSLVFAGVDWFRWGSWTGKEWTRVTESPFAHDVGGYAAATMEMHVRQQTDDGDSKEYEMLLTMVEMPREAISLGGVLLNDPFRNEEARNILNSFTVTLNN